MEREKRVMERARKDENGQCYMKKKMTTDTVCHYILYPVVYCTIGKSNDFYFHALRLSWNDRNILKDSRCLELLRGLNLKSGDIDSLDVQNLARCEESKWYTSSRKCDLAKIGKLAGHFLRRFACSVAKALDVNFKPEDSPRNCANDLYELFIEFKENKTIVPAIVKLEISPNSEFDASRFVCLTDEFVNVLANGKEMVISRRVTLLELDAIYHDWAWNLLNSFPAGCRQQLMNDLVNDEIRMMTVPLPGESKSQIDDAQTNIVSSQVENKLNTDIPMEGTAAIGGTTVADRRSGSARLKKRNKRYPLEEFVME